MNHFPGGKKTLALRERQGGCRRTLPLQKVLPERDHDLAQPALPVEWARVRVQEWVVDGERRPLQRLRCLREVVDVVFGSLFDPIGKEAAVLADRAVELRVWVLFPIFLPHDLRCVQLVWVELLAEVELSCDELVHSKDNELDIVTIFLVLELKVVLLIAFPAELGSRVEVKELDIIRA